LQEGSILISHSEEEGWLQLLSQEKREDNFLIKLEELLNG